MPKQSQNGHQWQEVIPRGHPKAQAEAPGALRVDSQRVWGCQRVLWPLQTLAGFFQPRPAPWCVDSSVMCRSHQPVSTFGH